MTSIRGIRRKRFLATAAAVLSATALFVTPQAHAASSPQPGTGSTQTLTITPTVTPQLSIVASTGTLTGLSNTVNPVVVTDTEMDSQQWTASMQATDCFPAGLTNAGSGSILPASAIQVNPGTGTVASNTLLDANAVAATLSSTFNFQAPASPLTGTTENFSPPQTLAYDAPTSGDALSNDGIFSLNPTITVNYQGASGFLALPSTSYTCQLQYTVAG